MLLAYKLLTFAYVHDQIDSYEYWLANPPNIIWFTELRSAREDKKLACEVWPSNR